MKTTTTSMLCATVLLILAVTAWAAEPPPLVNYQGVLRSADGTPLDGDFDMVFKYFGVETGGDHIFEERHLVSAGKPVTVNGGLFNVVLGSGFLGDGPGPGTYASLAEVFRDHGEVWLDIWVNGETLSPRVRVVSAAYSLNADHLDGLDSPQFLRSDTSDTFTTGELTLAAGTTLDANGEVWANGTIYLDYHGPEGTQYLFFYEDGAPAGEYFRWNNLHDRFDISDDLWVPGQVQADRLEDRNNTSYYIDPHATSILNTVQLSGQYTYFNYDGPDDQISLFFRDDGSSTNEFIQWSDTNDRFEFSNDVTVNGDLVGDTIVIGDETPTANPLFSAFGEAGNKDEAGIGSNDDLYIESDLEVDGYVYANYVKGELLFVQADTSQFVNIDFDNDSELSVYRWYHDETAAIAEIQEDGDLRIAGRLYQNESFDVAESFVAGEPLEPGDLVRIDPARPDGVLKTTGASDATLVGVVSSDPGMVLGGAPFDVETLRAVWGDEVHGQFLSEERTLKAELVAEYPELRQAREKDGRTRLEADLQSLALERFFERKFVPVALAGRVQVNVDASFGAVLPGDPLAPSAVPGVAMKADGSGPVIGTALESLESGRGRILVLVNRGHFTSGERIAAVEEEQVALADRIDERTPDPVNGVQSLPGHLQVVLDRNADDKARFSIFRDGEKGLGAEVLRVDEDGNVFAKGAFSPASMDVAEFFPVLEPFEVGHVVVASREIEGSCELARDASDPAVVGVVAERPGVTLGRSLERIASADSELSRRVELARRVGDEKAEAEHWAALERRFLKTHAAVAMSGSVAVKVDAGYGAIRVGDLLTTSPTPGHAMRADEALPGTILGKAITSLAAGTGSVRMLVMPR